MPPYIRPKQIMSRYGISRVTAWRWGQNSAMGFPKAQRMTDGVSLYDIAVLDAWFASRLAANVATGEPLPFGDNVKLPPYQANDDGQYCLLPPTSTLARRVSKIRAQQKTGWPRKRRSEPL